MLAFERSQVGGQEFLRFVDDRTEQTYGQVLSFCNDGTKLSYAAFMRQGDYYGELLEWRSYTHRNKLCYHEIYGGDNKRLYCNRLNPKRIEEVHAIARDHNLPLILDLPKNELDLTSWNLKYPDIPLIPSEKMTDIEQRALKMALAEASIELGLGPNNNEI